MQRAVSGSLGEGKRAGILFSGGLDSSLLAFLAKQSGASPLLICAGLEDSEDVKSARKVAAELGMTLSLRKISKEEIPCLYKKTAEVSGENDLMKVELGLLLLACCELAKADGIHLLLSGAGAEELFLGYHEHSKRCAKGENLDELRRKELEGLRGKDLLRSEKIAAHFGMGLALPYLEGGVVTAALAVPAAENFRNGENKAVLRSLARGIGVPEFACSRPKRAMQYGSGIHKAILSLKKRGEF